MNKRIKEWVQGLKKPKVLIFAGLLGIILIFLSSFSGGEEKTPQETKGDFSYEDYRICLQEDIKKMVTEITGSKKVNVVITLENSISYSYADTREETSAAESKENGDSSDMQIKAGCTDLIRVFTLTSPNASGQADIIERFTLHLSSASE